MKNKERFEILSIFIGTRMGSISRHSTYANFMAKHFKLKIGYRAR